MQGPQVRSLIRELEIHTLQSSQGERERMDVRMFCETVPFGKPFVNVRGGAFVIT